MSLQLETIGSCYSLFYYIKKSLFSSCHSIYSLTVLPLSVHFDKLSRASSVGVLVRQVLQPRSIFCASHEITSKISEENVTCEHSVCPIPSHSVFSYLTESLASSSPNCQRARSLRSITVCLFKVLWKLLCWEEVRHICAPAKGKAARAQPTGQPVCAPGLPSQHLRQLFPRGEKHIRGRTGPWHKWQRNKETKDAIS